MRYLLGFAILILIFMTDAAGLIDGYFNPVVENFILENNEGVLTLNITKLVPCSIEAVDWYLYDETTHGYVKLDIPALSSYDGDTIEFDGSELPNMELGDSTLVWRTTYPMGVLENTSRIYTKHNCFPIRFSFWQDHWPVPWHTITRLM